MIARSDALSAMPATRSTRTPVGPIEHLDSGTGPAFLALHGGMGGYDQSWLLSAALLAEAPRHRVVAVSRPGYLGTALVVGRTPQEQADALALLLDALEIPSVVVAAVSAGGPSALHFASRHAARCRALILVSAATGHLAFSERIESRLRFMSFMARIPGLAWLLRLQMQRNPAAAAGRAIHSESRRRDVLTDPERLSLLSGLQRSVFDRLAARVPGTRNDMATLAAMDDDIPQGITAPALILHGTADRIVPFSHAERVARSLQRARLVAIEGGEHIALFTDLPRVRDETAAFLAQNGAG